MIQGINHITFAVSDLAASAAFYQQALDAKLLFRDPQTAYFDLAGLWLALNVQENLPRQEPAYTHIAFTVDQDGLKVMEDRLRRLGIPIKPGRPREAGEGRSLYFADLDGHLLEVHCGDLKTRLAAYRKNGSG